MKDTFRNLICHLAKVWNTKSLNPFFLFRISMWKDFHKNAQYWEWIVTGPEHTGCLQACVSTFQSRHFTGWDSEGVKGTSLLKTGFVWWAEETKTINWRPPWSRIKTSLKMSLSSFNKSIWSKDDCQCSDLQNSILSKPPASFTSLHQQPHTIFPVY